MSGRRGGCVDAPATAPPGLRVLMIAAEALPFAKVGGLADVVGRLPALLARCGHDVRLVLPRYRGVACAAPPFERRWRALPVPLGRHGVPTCTVWATQLPAAPVRVYFVDYAPYFDRAGIYGEQGRGYDDNAQRFIFLSRAGLEIARLSAFAPQVIHVHDWHTAVTPLFLKTIYRGDPVLGAAASLLTIHNLEYQGRCGRQVMEDLAIGWQYFHPHGLEYYGDVNLLKGGIYHATLLNTVSPTHAAEILRPEYGFGLDGVLRDRAADLSGILNGLDEEVWDPRRDPHLAANFGPGAWQGKAVCKAALQRECGWRPCPDRPLIGMVSRLAPQKGMDVVAQAMAQLRQLDVQWVILGSGDAAIEAQLRECGRRHPSQLAVVIGFDNALAHRIEAGADFFLMPSRHEPCGTNQMISMRYGTVPIVRATGGLNDTVSDMLAEPSQATGIKFTELSTDGLLTVVQAALDLYRSRAEEYQRLRENGSRRSFSWETAVAAYEALYRRAVADFNRVRQAS